MPSREAVLPPLFPVAAAILLWGAVFTALPPHRQDFPLNDDWAYSKGAFAFARGEGVHYFRQPSMPLLGQWVLSYPLIRVAGESHAALRLLTMTLSLLGTLACYDLMRREAGLPPWEASFAATTLAVNPLVFLTSGTYMSDVPSFSLSLLALALYARALRSGRPGWLAAGAVLAGLAVVNRQNAVVTPLVAGALMWRDRALRWRPAWLLGVVLPIAAGGIASSWFAGRPDTVPLVPRIPSGRDVFVLGFAGSLYLGLSALPVLALRPGFLGGRWFLAALLLMLNGAAVCFSSGRLLFPPHAYHGGLFPYLENLITPWGTLESDIYVVGRRPLMMGRGAQVALTLAGCVGGAALADRLIGRLRGGAPVTALSLYSVLHASLLLASPTLYDRYLIVLMPGALALAAGVPLRARRLAGLGILALSAACSAGLAHDWLAWNSARWELGRRALARGIPVAHIEGGLEWDGWYAPVPVAPEGLDVPPQGLMLPFNRNRFPHLTGRYALSFSEIPGAVAIDTQPYRLWLVPRGGQFLLLKLQGDEAGKPATGGHP